MPSVRLGLTALLALAGVVATAGEPLKAREGEPLYWVLELQKEDEAARAKAVEELRKLGDAREKILEELERGNELQPRALAIIRRLQGEPTLARSEMEKIEIDSIPPLGANKAAGVEGNTKLRVDPKTKRVAMSATTLRDGGVLEFLICSRGPNAPVHETIAGIDAAPHDVATALLVAGYELADPIKEDGEVKVPPNGGILVSIQFDYEPAHGNQEPPRYGDEPSVVTYKLPAPARKTIRVPIEVFAWNRQTKKTMRRAPLAFTGSRTEKDPDTRKTLFMADRRRLIAALRLDPDALINTPLDMRGVDPHHVGGYEINWRTIPPMGTPCWVVFELFKGELKPEDLIDSGDKTAPASPPPGQ